MKRKGIKNLVAVFALAAVCGLTAGCGNTNEQDAQSQVEESSKAEEESSAEESSKAEEESSVEESSKAEEESSVEASSQPEEESTAQASKEPASDAPAMSGDWTDMTFVLGGKTYELPLAYSELEADGWTFELADYGYEDGYEMEPGDKVYATIDLHNPAYDEDLDICVGFKNYSDSVLDIKECDIWSLEMDTCYGHSQLESYPDMTIGNGLTIGSTKSDVEAVCGPCEDIYEAESYVKYTYESGDYTLKMKIYEDMGVVSFELNTYE